jgi:putative pyruvate formate lyase activating enzyme
VFCQNYQISREGMGRVLSVETDFARLCLDLQGHGAENINIVTGSHAVLSLAAGITAAREAGLSIPVLWNSSAYETVEALSLLNGSVDVYLPDLKTLDSAFAGRFFNAPDYPHYAPAAIQAMLEQRGELRYDRNGMLLSGVIVRHLVMPGHLEATRDALRWFAEQCRGRALLSLMTQYTPIKSAAAVNAPTRALNEAEYETALAWLDEYGIEDGFCQELVTGNEWLPDFRRPNPFSSELSTPIWH